jgi:hypothetical protein
VSGHRPDGQQRPRQDNGGEQPLRRMHRGDRGETRSSGRPQRFEPVRMR